MTEWLGEFLFAHDLELSWFAVFGAVSIGWWGRGVADRRRRRRAGRDPGA